MQDESDQDDDEAQGGGPALNVELLRSYLKFAKNAIVQRRLLVGFVCVLGMVLTFLVAKYLPRTYVCETEMMTVTSGVLESDRGPQPLAGAVGMIMSHDNLEQLIASIGLKKKFIERRPPLLALKDRVVASVFGPMDDKVLTAVLIGTLGSKVSAKAEKDTLTIDVEWHDGQTAAEIAEAAREGFLRIRHTAEMSAFQDKMAILDSHAVALRSEIGTLAQQMKESLAAKRAELEAQARAEAKAAGGDKAAAAVPTIKRTVRTRVSSKPVTDELLPELKNRLATLKQALQAAEDARNARISAEQAKVDELKLRLTSSHPQVIMQQERVGMAEQVSSELQQMRGEVQDLESQIRQREAMQQHRGSSTTIVSATASATATDAVGSEPLPVEIIGLLDEEDVDPALHAQISGAVTRYGSLRDDIRGAKLALDTAQAAFVRRYRVTVPVDVPTSPVKPKKAMVFSAGALLSLIFALLLPILLEIKRDVMVERWQVNKFQLPVLAELRLPPKDGSA
jgi:uncharacterized protein involved in exopolysaccharide biosynthesis